MQTVILAGGKGTRLKPYTTVFPKPLMPIGDLPILEVVIKQLKYYGFDDIVMAVGHLKELIQAFFNEGAKWGVQIRYSVEDKPLGTAAPLGLIPDLDDDFLVMNGDVLTNLNYAEFFEYHKSNKALCTIAMYKKPVHIDLGILHLNEANELTDYIEKPTLHYEVSMGVYAFKKEALRYIPKNTYFDFPDLIKTLLSKKRKVVGFPFEGYWLDIGRHTDYEQALDSFNNHKEEFLKEV